MLANKWFHFSYQQPSSYLSLRQARVEWSQQRFSLSTDEHDHHVIHYYTIASDNQTELQNLLFSAKLSGINLQASSLLFYSPVCHRTHGMHVGTWTRT